MSMIAGTGWGLDRRNLSRDMLDVLNDPAQPLPLETRTMTTVNPTESVDPGEAARVAALAALTAQPDAVPAPLVVETGVVLDAGGDQARLSVYGFTVAYQTPYGLERVPVAPGDVVNVSEHEAARLDALGWVTDTAAATIEAAQDADAATVDADGDPDGLTVLGAPDAVAAGAELTLDENAEADVDGMTAREVITYVTDHPERADAIEARENARPAGPRSTVLDAIVKARDELAQDEAPEAAQDAGAGDADQGDA